jgi:hypothetical protein
MGCLYYFDGAVWRPISGGGGGTPGPQGPPGPPGKSINVFVQPTTPTNPSVGDHWINETAARKAYKTLDDLVTYKTLDDLKTYPTLDDLKGN